MCCVSTGNHGWVGSDFSSNAGVGLVLRMQNSVQDNDLTIVDQVKAVFERDWRSRYAKSLQGNRDQPGKFSHLHQGKIHIENKEEKEWNDLLYL